MTKERRTALLLALRWIEDITKYDEIILPPFRKYKQRFSKADIIKLVKNNKFIYITPRCSVKGFTVPEWKKKRRRPIFWPDINKYISPSMLAPSTLPRQDDARKQGMHGAYSLQYDMISWFDQIPLVKAISALFSVFGSLCLASLPMGFRPAVEVAEAIIKALVDFELPQGVTVLTYIDNVRFIGPTAESVLEAGKMFRQRCDFVGAKINEQEDTPLQEDEFLGTRYNYVQKTRCLSNNTIDKLNFVLSNLKTNLTHRQIASVLGLLFFSSDVLNHPIAKHYHTMTWYRGLMANVPNNWDEVAPSIGPVANDLQQWIETLIQNTPTAMFVSVPDYDLQLFIDASDYGWGCVSFTRGSVKEAGQRWSDEERSRFNLASSVVSEPLGAWKAIAQNVTKDHKHVLVVTDHLPLKYAGNRGYGKAWSYNELCKKLGEHFPTTKFTFAYIKGEQNIADGISRGIPNKDIQEINQQGMEKGKWEEWDSADNPSFMFQHLTF